MLKKTNSNTPSSHEAAAAAQIREDRNTEANDLTLGPNRLRSKLTLGVVLTIVGLLITVLTVYAGTVSGKQLSEDRLTTIEKDNVTRDHRILNLEQGSQQLLINQAHAQDDLSSIAARMEDVASAVQAPRTHLPKMHQIDVPHKG